METLAKTVIVRFVLIRSKMNQQGRCPLKIRLTLNGKRKVFSSGIFIEPKYWNSKQQKITGNNDVSLQYNRTLQLHRSKILTAQLELEVESRDYSTDDIYRRLKGEKALNMIGILEFYESYLKRTKSLIDIDIKQVTWNKFFYIYQDLKRFISIRFNKKDIQITKLDLKFINDFEYYYKVDRKLKQITINKKIQRFKKVINEAVANKHISQSPFFMHRAKRVNREVVFLTEEELFQFKAYVFKQPRLNLVKDLFIFSCYTGLGYREVMNLSNKNLVKGFDGNLWIQINRQKTNKLISVPLLPEALRIIEKYKSSNHRVLPKISNQRYNSYLKEISHIVGIEKRMTTHMARRTFASTVLLYNNVPIEVVSRLLGHSKIQTTQDSYAQIVEKRISKEIEKLKG